MKKPLKKWLRCTEMSRTRHLQDQQGGSLEFSLEISRERKSKFTDIISSPITLFYYKNILPHSIQEISILWHNYFFLLLFPSVGQSPYQCFTNTSAGWYFRNLCIQLMHTYNSGILDLNLHDNVHKTTVNFFNCVSTKPVSCTE